MNQASKFQILHVSWGVLSLSQPTVQCWAHADMLAIRVCLPRKGLASASTRWTQNMRTRSMYHDVLVPKCSKQLYVFLRIKPHTPFVGTKLKWIKQLVLHNLFLTLSSMKAGHLLASGSNDTASWLSEGMVPCFDAELLTCRFLDETISHGQKNTYLNIL